MKTKVLVAISTFVLASLSAVANAGIVFTFTENAGNVLMTSSGSINTNNLVLRPDVSSWGGTGVEENGNHDIMGGTDVGNVDISFGFNSGTNFAPWATANGPFTQDQFPATVTAGVKGFTTYIRIGGVDPQLPGLGVERADIVNGIWTPDQMWQYSSATFATLGMVVGVYTVTDAVTGEFITIQIGSGNPVPAPLPLALLAVGAIGLLRTRRARSAA